MRRWLRWFGVGLTRGQRGERLAARFLKKQGHRLLGRNLTTKQGEVDLLTRDVDGTVCIIEVKTGTQGQTPPQTRVNAEKRRRLVALAAQLARKHGLTQQPIRFDIVAVQLPPDGTKGSPSVEHFPNAFEAH